MPSSQTPSLWLLLTQMPVLWLGLVVSILGLALALEGIVTRIWPSSARGTSRWEVVLQGLLSTVFFGWVVVFLLRHATVG